jgi:uncharacterized protein YbbC (DUF1343 family)
LIGLIYHIRKQQKYSSMAKVRQFIFLAAILISSLSCKSREALLTIADSVQDTSTIIVGASLLSEYLPLVRDKNVAVVGNQTSLVGNEHLVDILLREKVNVVKVFAPEHGFRGEAGPGDKVNSGKDSLTGLPLFSLYGANKKPSAADLAGINCIVFDIQDVGARFYTYISTLQLVMEACAEHNIFLVVLDRPNPNGFYVDGPVCDTAFRSFVGMAPIPIVHGLTVGEYAKMVNGEGWLSGGLKCMLEVVKMKNYSHSKLYRLPVAPSPNLRRMEAIYLYPSLCLFEGTAVSVGRGTGLPFELIGYPGFKGDKTFTPKEIQGVIKDPPYEDVECSGIILSENAAGIIASKKLNISWLIEMYKSYPDKSKFFNNFFDRLAGSSRLRTAIVQGKSEEAIRKSWDNELAAYKVMRERYLLYPE